MSEVKKMDGAKLSRYSTSNFRERGEDLIFALLVISPSSSEFIHNLLFIRVLIISSATMGFSFLICTL